MLQLTDVEHRAFKKLRQQAGIASADQGDFREQAADLQFAARVLELERAGGFGVFVHRTRIGIARSASAVIGAGQQGAAAAVWRGVELQAQACVEIQADADGGGGVAGFPFEDKALGPFFNLRLGRCLTVAQVVVVIEVA
ncbi:hypothetical protein D3C80_1556530 [compost metagenome]